MIKHFFTLLFIIITNLLFAQSFNSPESVDYHIGSSIFLISNSGNGQILTDDGLGNLNILATGVGIGPHGLEVIDDLVYACSGGRLKAYNVLNGNQTLNHNINGQFLNESHIKEMIFSSLISLEKNYIDITLYRKSLIC